jgi:pimeloyl-ACP methyl ester carboxylesterase
MPRKSATNLTGAILGRVRHLWPPLRWDANPPYEGFSESFANGVEPETAAILFAAQRPAAADEFSEHSGTPAWKTIPSGSLIGTQDKVIPLALQEEMGNRAGAHISRVKAGHLSLITRPGDVTEVILSAVEATT